MNGGELRFGYIENRLSLCLLIRGQVQLLRDPLKAERVALLTRPGLSLHNNQAAKRYRARGYKR